MKRGGDIVLDMPPARDEEGQAERARPGAFGHFDQFRRLLDEAEPVFGKGQMHGDGGLQRASGVGGVGAPSRSVRGEDQHRLRGRPSLRRERLRKDLEPRQKAVDKAFGAWWRARRKDDVGDAFAAGLDILAEGFLTVEGTDPDIRKAMDAWAAEAREHKLPRKTTRAYADLVKRLDKGLGDAWKDFEKAERTFRSR